MAAAGNMSPRKPSFAPSIQCAERAISMQEDDPVTSMEMCTRTGLSGVSMDSSMIGSSVTAACSMDAKRKGKDRTNTTPQEYPTPNFESYPQGFPRLAAFQNSSSDLASFRRFGTAHCRVLMHLQCEITSIIKELDDLDLSDARNGGMLYRLRRNEWYEGLDRTQKDLLEKLQEKLVVYDDLLLKDRGLRAIPSPKSQHYQNLFNWIMGHKPLDGGQYDFLFDRDDFVAAPTACNNANRFDEIIERCLNRWPESKVSQRLLGDESRLRGTSSAGVYAFSRTKTAVAAKLLSVSVAGALLLIPVFLLYLTKMRDEVMAGVVLIFVLAFGILLSLFTAAGIDGVFVGTCTYCAVLVAFLGSLQVRTGEGGK